MSTITADKVSVGTGESFSDRRRSRREPTGFRGWVRRGAETLAEVALDDMSFHGLAFRSAQALELGSAVEIVIHRPETYNLRANLCIVSCRPEAGGGFRVGAEIV